ncbi:MAG: tetratricopeptide repeat protein, partial [Ignavibacteriaceae bacterium]|nr:tetratricopeptide repeat protein [Ignavibacteriaceae bacterium]
EIYKKGIEQFAGNMHDILEMAKKQNVPVILGTLACNLKDQFPFVSIKDNNNPPADKVYLQAKESLASNSRKIADSLFRFAKDLDALRFRAPSEINKSIINLGREFNYAIVNIDSVFETLSPDHITGDNLMTDHLHPTLKGYQIIGDIFYKEMEKLKILPKTKPKNWNDIEQDSITVTNFPFTRLDTIISDFRIRVLKNDWPYVNKENKIPDSKLFHLKDYIDTIAYNLIYDRMNWEAAHSKAANWYAERNDINSFTGIMNVLISQYPIVTEYYDYTANILLEKKDYDMAYYYLNKRNEIEPTAYSTKWIGIINLFRNHIDNAEEYLNESLSIDKNDSQVWYNLAGVYVNKNNYSKALEMVNKAISLQSNYPEAIALQKQLQQVIK